MKINIGKYLFFCCFFSFTVMGQGQEITCILKGKVIDRESKALVLYKSTADSRRERTIIPIEDGHFEYQLEAADIEMYSLAFKEEIDTGVWQPIIFFAEDGAVAFKLHSSEMFEKNTVSGGVANAELTAYNAANQELFKARQQALNKEREDLDKQGRLYAKAMIDLQREIGAVKDQEERKKVIAKMRTLRTKKEDLTPEGRKVEDASKAIIVEYLDWKERYIADHSTPLSYFLFYQQVRGLKSNKLSIIDIRKRYDKLAQVFPKHPYTSLIGKMIESHATVKVGEDLIDFTAPDLEDNNYQFSSLAIGKVVLLDLWASWCGPCIKKSRTIIPVYEAYKDKGFTVVGVAREFKNSDRLIGALEREKFPWLNLIDLDDQQEVWMKYNIPYSGGGTFLIDEKGKILEIDPTAESIREVMEARQ